MLVFMILSGLVLVLLLAAVPFFLSWQAYVRWVVALAAVPDPWGLLPTAAPGLQEVGVEAVTRGPDGLLVWLGGVPGARLRVLSLRRETPEVGAQLEQWAAAGTPLIHVPGPAGEVILLGPTSSVGDLQAVSDPDGPEIRVGDVTVRGG